MTLFRYRCRSSTGKDQVGFGETEHEVGSDEHTRKLLQLIAKTAHNDQIPWDPFNVTLVVVRAHIELKPFNDYYQP